MSQLQLRRPAVSPDDLDTDDFAAPYFRWPRVERTCAAIAGAVDDAANVRVYVPHTTPPPAASPLRVVTRFRAGTEVLHLDDVNFPMELRRLLVEAAGSVVSVASDEADLGAPKVDVLLGAVEDLTAWTGLTKQKLAKYVGVSYSTILSWRREKPVHPRHPRIPTLLTLWSAVSGALEEFGVEDAARMVWAAGKTGDGQPAIPADDLAAWLIDETSEANLSEFLTEDGYEAGTAPVADVEELTAAEGRLHAALEAPHVESDARAGR